MLKSKTKNAAVLFSGGKDSCLALHKAKQEGWEIKFLLNVFPKTKDSFMFHKPDLDLLARQAEELDIELIVKETSGEKERELEDLKSLINSVKDKIDAIVVGGIASSYQGGRIKKICSELGLEFYTPLWDYNSEEIWDELFSNGFEVILMKISTEGIGKEWIGKIIDKKKFDELKKLSEKYKFRLDFEGGEAESAVLFMPEFKKHIKIKFDSYSEGEYRHFIDIKKIE